MDLSDSSKQSPDEHWFAGGLRFRCTGCGKCCTGSSGSVYLSKPDLERLANFFRLPVGAFARKYTRVSKGRRVLVDGPASRDCVFLTAGTCGVYEARPTQCRTYPWWLSNIRDQESWEAAAEVCEGINHPSAPLISPTEIFEQSQMDRENESS